MAKDHAQSDIGEMMGWSREKVKDYNRLQYISPIAWELIGAELQKIAPNGVKNLAPQIGANAPVTGVVTVVTFTERLLRNLLPFIENGLLVGIATTP